MSCFVHWLLCIYVGMPSAVYVTTYTVLFGFGSCAHVCIFPLFITKKSAFVCMPLYLFPLVQTFFHAQYWEVLFHLLALMPVFVLHLIPNKIKACTRTCCDRWTNPPKRFSKPEVKLEYSSSWVSKLTLAISSSCRAALRLTWRRDSG